MHHDRARKLVGLLMFIAAALVAWSLLVFWTGGIRETLGPISISSRDPHRPLFIALAVAILAGVVAFRSRVNPFTMIRSARDWSRTAPRDAVWLAAAVVLTIGIAWGSHTAAGADQFGYLSQAHQWRHLDLRIELPPNLLGPDSPIDAWSLSPLGYRPSVNRDAIVPTYAPGLAILMALVMLVFGECATYFITPVCAAALVLLTDRVGRAITTRGASALAAVLMASSPTLLFMLMFPMSDIPTATFWMASLAASLAGERPRPVLAGIAAGIATLIRPNLVPLAIVPALVLLWRYRSWRTLFAYGAASAPFAIAVGLINAYLYGSPLASGYGSTDSLYSSSFIGPNLRNYSTWLLESQGVLVFAFVLALLIRIFGRAAAGVWASAAFLVIVLASYLPYLVFEAWWYLRFFLPVFPLVFILTADAFRWVSDRFPARVAPLVFGGLAAVMLYHSVAFAKQTEFYGLGEGDQRYVEVGLYARDHLPPNAVIFAMQHSGSVGYYSGRMTIRYDQMAGHRFPETLQLLRSRGYRPYVVLDDGEEVRFKEVVPPEHHGFLGKAPIAVQSTGLKVRLYDLDGPEVDVPEPVRRVSRWPCTHRAQRP
jgi:hypothetical protein